mmetsp:Transcript_64612/g.120300  ORF Transcript_64612/g.120300 Transcript_64612/m.120300 type:complete len:249 (+) Transcript_64612:344-1090(+)
MTTRQFGTSPLLAEAKPRSQNLRLYTICRNMGGKTHDKTRKRHKEHLGNGETAPSTEKAGPTRTRVTSGCPCSTNCKAAKEAPIAPRECAIKIGFLEVRYAPKRDKAIEAPRSHLYAEVASADSLISRSGLSVRPKPGWSKATTSASRSFARVCMAGAHDSEEAPKPWKQQASLLPSLCLGLAATQCTSNPASDRILLPFRGKISFGFSSSPPNCPAAVISSRIAISRSSGHPSSLGSCDSTLSRVSA